MKKECIILVGFPGVGKSTFTAQNYPDYQVASSDKYIQQYADENGISYDRAIHTVIEDTVIEHDEDGNAIEVVNKFDVRRSAEKQFKQDIQKFIDNHENFIVDRTNMAAKARHKIICRLNKKKYKITVINFIVNNMEEYFRRINSRPGKTISQRVIDEMTALYHEPSLEEGMDEIKTIEIN